MLVHLKCFADRFHVVIISCQSSKIEDDMLENLWGFAHILVWPLICIIVYIPSVKAEQRGASALAYCPKDEFILCLRKWNLNKTRYLASDEDFSSKEANWCQKLFQVLDLELNNLHLFLHCRLPWLSDCFCQTTKVHKCWYYGIKTTWFHISLHILTHSGIHLNLHSTTSFLAMCEKSCCTYEKYD